MDSTWQRSIESHRLAIVTQFSLSSLLSVIFPYFNFHFCSKPIIMAQLLTNGPADDDTHTDWTEPHGRGPLDPCVGVCLQPKHSRGWGWRWLLWDQTGLHKDFQGLLHCVEQLSWEATKNKRKMCVRRRRERRGEPRRGAVTCNIKLVNIRSLNQLLVLTVTGTRSHLHHKLSRVKKHLV